MRIPASLLFLVMLLGCAAPQSSPVVQPTGAPASQTPVVQPTGAPASPTANAAFAGSLEAVPGVSGDISFVISDTGQIAEMRLDGGLTNFDCGAGKTIVDSGNTTYFFPDPITIEGGRFSVSRGDPLPRTRCSRLQSCPARVIRPGRSATAAFTTSAA